MFALLEVINVGCNVSKNGGPALCLGNHGVTGGGYLFDVVCKG